MSDDFISSARKQERELTAALEASPLFRKLQIVRRTISEWESVGAQDNTIETIDRASPVRSTEPRRAGSKTATTIDAVRKWLSETRQRAQTPAILAEMKRRGIEYSGKNPGAGLAGILSASPIFDNVQGEGYGLAEWAQSIEPRKRPMPNDESQQAPSGDVRA